MEKPTRFDLEQQILDCWGITDDLKLLAEAEGNQRLSKDQTLNILIGLQELYNLKFEQMFNTFEKLVASKNIT
jgi:hypothetical protein